MESIDHVGFVGLGNMGLPMAGRLADAGFKLIVFDSDPKAVKKFTDQHPGRTAACISELGAGSDVVITMLPDGNIVRRVVMGSDGAVHDNLIHTMPKGATFIDMSSSSPAGTQALGQQLSTHGIAMLDAPVSGGVTRAIAGTLAIMVGGEPAVIRRCATLFEIMGERLFETGRLGSGHSMKVLNNLVSAAGLIAAAEALLIGARFGLKPETMIEVLNASTGRNNSTENKFNQFVLSRKFNSGFSLALMVKDLTTAMELAQQNAVTADFSKLCQELWSKAQKELEQGSDHTAVVRWFENIAGMELR
jgi:3-hydroxyisobutyrate dehydrogenase